MVSGIVSLPQASVAAPQARCATSLPFPCATLSENVSGKRSAHERKIPPDSRLIKMKLLLRPIKRIPDYITLT
jgi:hypothetical protein